MTYTRQHLYHVNPKRILKLLPARLVRAGDWLDLHGDTIADLYRDRAELEEEYSEVVLARPTPQPWEDGPEVEVRFRPIPVDGQMDFISPLSTERFPASHLIRVYRAV